MIRKMVQKHRLDKDFEIKQNLEYRLSRPPEERLAAVEFLRRQVYGNYSQRIQKVVRVIKQKDLADIEALDKK
jgi:phosphomevalonate kinase